MGRKRKRGEDVIGAGGQQQTPPVQPHQQQGAEYQGAFKIVVENVDPSKEAEVRTVLSQYGDIRKWKNYYTGRMGKRKIERTVPLGESESSGSEEQQTPRVLEQPQQSQASGFRCLLENLNPNCSQVDIRNMCTQFGYVTDIQMCANRKSCYVTFAEKKAMVYAIGRLHGYRLGGGLFLHAKEVTKKKKRHRKSGGRGGRKR